MRVLPWLVPTEAHFSYPDESFHADPVIDRQVPGDGTVTLDVLEQCTQWDRVAQRAFEGGEHLGLLHEKRFLDHVAMLVTDCWSEQPAGARNPRCPEVGTEPDPR